MKTILIFAFSVVALADISCTDKSRLLAAVQDGKELPNGSAVPIMLDQNYPNPFNQSTSIEFWTVITQHIRLSVKTEDWVTVATLYDTTLAAGLYRASWSAAGLPSGEYLAVLEGGSVTEVIRMRLVK